MENNRWTGSVMGHWRVIACVCVRVFSEWVLQPVREWGHLLVDASQRSPWPQRLLNALLFLATGHRRLLPVTWGEDMWSATPEPLLWDSWCLIFFFCGWPSYTNLSFSVPVFQAHLFRPASKKVYWICSGGLSLQQRSQSLLLEAALYAVSMAT